MTVLKNIASKLALALFGVFSIASCSAPLALELLSFDVETASLTGLRSAEVVVAMEINNKAHQNVKFSAVEGTLKTPDVALAGVTGEDFTVLRDTCMKYRVPLKVRVDPSASLIYVAGLFTGGSLDDLLIDASLDYRMGKKALRHVICKDMRLETLSDEKELLKKLEIKR